MNQNKGWTQKQELNIENEEGKDNKGSKQNKTQETNKSDPSLYKYGHRPPWTQQRDDQCKFCIDLLFTRYQRDENYCLTQAQFKEAFNEVSIMLYLRPVDDPIQMQQIASKIAKQCNHNFNKNQLFISVKQHHQ